jgi:hypothetical protein
MRARKGYPCLGHLRK